MQPDFDKDRTKFDFEQNYFFKTYFNIVTPFAFVIKSVDSVDGSTFVVAAEKEEIFRIP